jgi:hypothetical protein
MGNSIYEENKRLRAEADTLRQKQREEAENRDEQAKMNFEAIVAGIAGLLSGKAMIHVGDIPVQVRWMHDAAPPRQPSDASGMAERPVGTSAA